MNANIFQKIHILSFIVFFLLIQSHAFAQEEQVTKQPILLTEQQLLYNSYRSARKAGDLLKARVDLEQIINRFPNLANIDVIRRIWGHLMMSIIHSNASVPEAILYEVRPGDALEKIAKEHGTTIELIIIRNKLQGKNLKVGQKLSVWNRPFMIDVYKETNHLDLKIDGKVIKTYAVSTGKSNTTTPVGKFTVKSRYPFPAWFHHGVVVPGGSPENWLGTRWLGFDKPKYGIHGTIYPELIGQSVSGGCIRMRNKEVEELYDMIPIGTKVNIQEGEE